MGLKREKPIIIVVIVSIILLFIGLIDNTYAASVKINGRQILVNGKPFTIKGVNYSPVPIGVDPETTPPYGDYFTQDYKGIYERDLPLIRKMGANTIRLHGWNNTADHHDFLDKTYNNGVDPIYVITTFAMDPSLYPDISSPSTRAKIKADFRAMVAAHKEHPAILMWSIGDGLNASGMYGDRLNDLFGLINEMAGEAHQEEGPNFHPVIVPLVDVDLINTIANYEPFVASADIWGADINRGSSFGTLFDDFKAVTTKPLVITGFGIDAYDENPEDEYENVGIPYQATYAESLWQEITANSKVCSGGIIRAYSDEWWLGKLGNTLGGCPDLDPAFHSPCGHLSDSDPDGFVNYEWFGIMRVVKDGSNIDIMEPREAYFTLKRVWAVARATPLDNPACPSTISFGQTIQCSISAPNETDTFTFSASASDKVIIRITLTSGTLSPGIRLYGPDGTKLSEQGSFPFSTAEISYTLPTSGTYTILAYDSGGTGTGGYNLYLQRLNNPGSPTPITFGQTLSGSIGGAAKMDAYTFSANAGDKVIIRITLTSGTLSPGIRLYGPDGTKLSEQGSFPFSTAEISYTLPTSGTYTILAYDWGGTGTGGYNISLRYATPGTLVVSPTEGLSSTGYKAGPFTPSSKSYTLQNTGEESINWTASKTQSWVGLSASSGTLAKGASTNVTLSITTDANSLATGSYSDAIAFTNTTNGNGNTTRNISLTVWEPGQAINLPLCSTPVEISLSSGSYIWYKLNVPQTDNLFVIVQKKEQAWTSTITIKKNGQSVASVNESGDSILQLNSPQAGEYILEISASASGTAMVRACTNLPVVVLGNLFVGTIYHNDGYDWSQMDIPAGTGAIEFTVETVGNVSALDVWRGSYGSNEHWYAQQSFNPPVKLTITNPQSGRYYLRVSDHGVLSGGSQVRDYSIIVQTAQGTETVSTPNMPGGTTSGMPSTSYIYSTGGSSSSLGHNIQYFFDWGDGTNSGWLPVGTTSASKSWASAGTYPVKAKARCATHTSVESSWSGVLNVIISTTEAISAPNIPSGPTNGVPGTGYSYSTWGSSSNLGHSIQYFFDWGDGTNSGWLSAEVTIVSKSWGSAGTYSVKAKARCSTDTSIESSWSGVLSVTVTNTLTITGVSPIKGGNTGTVTVTFAGVNLDPNGQIKLTRTGEADIIPQSVTGSADGTRLTATLDLTGKAPGIWNFVVTNSIGQSAVLQNAFTIEPGGEAKLWVEIVGMEQMRVGRWHGYVIQCGNSGNVDLFDLVLTLRLPQGTEFRLDLPHAVPSWVPLSTDVEGRVLIPFWILRLSAQSKLDIPIMLSPSPSSFVPGDYFEIRTEIIKAPDSEYSKTGSLAVIDSSPTFRAVVNAVLGTLSNKQSTFSEAEQLDLTTEQEVEENTRNFLQRTGRDHAWIIVRPPYEGMAIGAVVGAVLSPFIGVNPWTGAGVGAGIGGLIQTGITLFNAEVHVLRGAADLIATAGNHIVGSYDPNIKTGPSGFDPEGTPANQVKRYGTGDHSLGYMVSFENLETATAAVQDMSITDHLDSNLDWSKFSFDTIQIGTHTLSVPQGNQSFTADVDFRPEMPAIVQVRCSFDQQTGVAQCYFKGVDPSTGEFADFLPPNTDNVDPRGQGWVSYSVKPKPNLPTGTVIRNKATIDFEVGVPPAPLDTPEVFNTIDSVAPSSSVSPLAATQNTTNFTVSWGGSDDPGGSGIKNYDIYVSDNGGPYSIWLTASETSATFTGETGHQYSFYSRARDNVGNLEDAPPGPDASTMVTLNVSTISLTSPSNGAVFDAASLINKYQPSFKWSTTETFTKYTILFSTSSSEFSAPLAKATIQRTQNSWTPPIGIWKKIVASSYNNGSIQDIYWKVIGTKPDKTPIESEVRSFRVGPPQTVTIQSPLNQAVLPSGAPPTFEFNTNCNVKFRVEFSTVNDFSDPTKIRGFNYSTRDPNLDTTLHKTLSAGQWTAVKKLIGTGTGYFRIKGSDGLNRETVSEVRSFAIQ